MSEKIKQLKIKLADGYSKGIPFESDGVSDVQINGTSVVTDGVANVPTATSDMFGVVCPDDYAGLTFRNGKLSVNPTTDKDIRYSTQGNAYKPIPATKEHLATFYGLAKAAGFDEVNNINVGTYTESAKSAISDMLNGAVQVSGTTPTITALSGVRYVCGEVSTLDITPCASGICDVIFTSGSTATVLTLPSTVKFPDGAFTPEADTVYELNIMDGVYGAVMAWT